MKNCSARNVPLQKNAEPSHRRSAWSTIRGGKKHSTSLAVSCALLTFITDANAVGYTFTLLNPTIGTISTAYAINNSGKSVGYSQIVTSGGEARASLWSGTGYDLGNLGRPNSEAHAINDAGLIVGWGTQPSGPGFARAILWDGTSVVNLGTLGGIASYATGINNGGTIAGASYTTGDVLHAARWTATSIDDLGTLGGKESWAQAVNDSGKIVGNSQILSGNGSSATVHAAMWVGTTATDLGTLGGSNSNAVAINNQGQVVGNSQTSNGFFRATIWEGTTIADLGTLGGANSGANDVNSGGQVVGTSTLLGEMISHAALWDSGKAIDLNDYLDSDAKTIGWILETAWAINDSGWIVGSARNSYTNTVQGFMLSTATVPEPSTAALVIFALGVVAARRRRRNCAITT